MRAIPGMVFIAHVRNIMQISKWNGRPPYFLLNNPTYEKA